MMVEKGGGRKSWGGWDEWQQQGIMRLWMGVCKSAGRENLIFLKAQAAAWGTFWEYCRTDLITLIDMVGMM